MVLFLASVISVSEAEVALRGNVDIIGIEVPVDGAQGALSPEFVGEVVGVVAGRKPVSAMCGNRPMSPEEALKVAKSYAATGVDYLAIRLWPQLDTATCISALSELTAGTKIVAVLFADRNPDFTLLPLLAESGWHGVMLDTADKRAGGLLCRLSADRVAQFVGQARSLGLVAGLCGSLEEPDIPRLLALGPDILGFRTTLCASGRDGAIQEDAIRRIRTLIPEEGRVSDAPKVENRSLAAGNVDFSTDKIFVQDFVLPVEIGVYSHERGHKQKVRFDVEAEVTRITDNPQTIRDVISYDIIMDGIRTIASSGHVDLVEALAERVARQVLAIPGVMRVRVRVEKVEIAPARVGVEIVRERQGRG